MNDIWAKVEELRRLKAAATTNNIATADVVEAEEIECPMCGEGEVDRTIYLNYDGVATSVAFYGVGPEHGANEKYFLALHKNAMDVIDALLLHRNELMSAAKSVIPHAETPKEDTPENWAWQIRMMGEDRRAAYRQLHEMQIQRDALTKKLKIAEANASKWQSTADVYCKKMNDAMAVLSEWNNIDKAEAIARWQEFSESFPGGLGQAQQAKNMSIAATESLGLNWDEASPSDIRNAILLLDKTKTGEPDEPRCPYCGYTEQDKREMMDHHICEQKQVEEAAKRR